MKNNKVLKYFIYLLIFLFVSHAIFYYIADKLDYTKPLTPKATFKLINGNVITLDSLKGKPVLVVFWATTCKICIKEIPDLVELHHFYAKKGLEIIAVAMSYDHPAAVVRLAKKMQLPYKVALDVDNKVRDAFVNVQVTPTIFLVANEGHIIMRAVGKLKMGLIKQLIEEELKG